MNNYQFNYSINKHGFAGRLGATVVGDDDLEIVKVLRQARLQREGKRVPAIARGNDDAESRCAHGMRPPECWAREAWSGRD